MWPYIENTSQGCVFSGKASRKLVESCSRLTDDSTCVLETEPGKLNFKKCKPGILFFSLQVVSLFKLASIT